MFYSFTLISIPRVAVLLTLVKVLILQLLLNQRLRWRVRTRPLELVELGLLSQAVLTKRQFDKTRLTVGKLRQPAVNRIRSAFLTIFHRFLSNHTPYLIGIRLAHYNIGFTRFNNVSNHKWPLSQKDSLLRIELLALGGGGALSRWFRSWCLKVNLFLSE